MPALKFSQLAGSLDRARHACAPPHVIPPPTVPPQKLARNEKATTRPGRAIVSALRSHDHVHWILILAIFLLGTWARTWEFGRLPPGLNPDEASTGIEALYVGQYGTDRNGVSLPVKFISWGSGQDVLYAYLLAPLVAWWGLGPTLVRLPMLIFGIAAMPLMYLVARQLFGARAGLWATLLLAISPWHILLSRWALDSNLLPFFFIAAFASLLQGLQRPMWLLLAGLLFGICMYAYGTAYAVVPLFLVLVVFIDSRWRILSRRHLTLAVLLYALVAAPIFLLLLINGLGLDSIRMGPVTIPHFPVAVRWQTTTLLGTSDPVGTLFSNLKAGAVLLASESDGILYNVVDPFGYLYHVGLALGIGGVILLFTPREGAMPSGRRLMLAWLAAAVVVPVLQPVNINRLNILFPAMVILGGYAISYWVARHRVLGPTFALGLGVVFIAFTAAYHGGNYRRQADLKFQTGILPALRFAGAITSGRVCVTDKINMPYIYALFVQRPSPADFLSTVRYLDATEPLRQVASFGRYTFGVRQCPAAQDATYVVRDDEIPPRFGNRYDYKFFDRFVVYYPKSSGYGAMPDSWRLSQ